MPSQKPDSQSDIVIFSLARELERSRLSEDMHSKKKGGRKDGTCFVKLTAILEAEVCLPREYAGMWFPLDWKAADLVMDAHL